jgi:cytochrome P450
LSPGDYVRYSPNGLIVNTATGLKDIYSHGKNFKKSKHYLAMVHQAFNTLTAIDKKKHGKKRRVMSQGFSDAALKSHEDVVLKQVSQLCTQLRITEDGHPVGEGQWAPPKNMAHWSDYFTFDVMSNIIFGVPWSTLRSPTYRFVPGAIAESNVRVGTIGHAPLLTLFRMDKYLFPASIAARNRFIKFIDEMLKEGIKAASKTGKGVFALLTNAKDPETGLPLKMKELAGESATLIVAGT